MLQKASVVAHVAANIRALCDSQASISELCRRIGISRQQFNKYLSGQHIPSRHNLGLFASYFSIDQSDLFLPPPVFAKKKIEARPFEALKSLGNLQRFAEFARATEASICDARKYCGVYERYQYSSIYDGSILRSIVSIREMAGVLCHCNIERFPSKDRPDKTETEFDYRGFTFSFGGRLFMIDFESKQQNEITSTALAPRVRSSTILFFGLTVGVAASLTREPFATRVAMRRVSEGRLQVQHVHRATALKPNDASIPKDIAEYLNHNKQILRAVDGALMLNRRPVAARKRKRQ